MKLFRSVNALKRGLGRGCVATIGAFDGVHLAHQQIISQLLAQGHRLGLPTVLLSFEPLPKEYFATENPPPRLTRFREKFGLLAGLQLDAFFCPRFDEYLRSMSPQQFISELLVDAMGARHIIVGHDFRFAARRAGTIDDLIAAGAKAGFTVEQVPAIFHDRQRVSSTAVRAALVGGDIEAARAMLGRYYAMSGRVVRGKAFGRQLGFPTANVHLKRRQSPVMGIFAVQVTGLEGEPLNGVASVGTRPTVEGNGMPLLEVFLFDFDRDIYGQIITVHFIKRLRDELKFSSIEALQDQMHRDVAEARAVLAA